MAINTTIPLIPPYDGERALRSNPATFPENAETEATFFTTTLPNDANDSINAMNTLAGEVEQEASDAESSANLAGTYADNAASSSNYQGEWSTLSGAYSKGASVSHNESFWRLKLDTASIETIEPEVGTNWAQLTNNDLQIIARSRNAGDSAVTYLNAGELISSCEYFYESSTKVIYKSENPITGTIESIGMPSGDSVDVTVSGVIYTISSVDTMDKIQRRNEDYEANLDVRYFGAVADYSTDNTTALVDAIKTAYSSGGGTVYIPEGCKYSTQAIMQYETGTITVDSPDTIEGLTITEDFVGCFIWNVTDNSYATIESQTATSLTVTFLELGTNNTFTIGDEYVISMFKVGVNIRDDSRWSEHNNAFTGQSKQWVNSPRPKAYSANEKHVWGQYHPAYIIINQNPSDMEGRASFLARRINREGKIQSFIQMGLNPVNNTDSVNDPGAAADFLIVGGHNEGVPTNNVSQAANIFSQRFADDMVGQYYAMGGGRARPGTTLWIRQLRNIQNEVDLDAAGTQRTKLRFSNNGVEKRSIYHWGVYDGFSGYFGIVIPRTTSFSIDQSLYAGVTFTNEGAVSGVTFTLPSTCPVGYEQTFVQVEGVLMSFTLSGGETFLQGNNGRTTSAVGATMTIKKVTSNKWTILSSTGSWTT